MKIFTDSAENHLITLVLENFDFETSWTLEELQKISPFVKPGNNFVYSEELLRLIQHLIDSKLYPNSKSIYNSCVTFLLLYLSVGDVSVLPKRKSIYVRVSSKMPNGAGLGSSSSYIVSLAQALFTAHNVTIEKKVLNQWCFEMDKLFHGKPSGIDNSICTFGGAILFGSGQIIENIESEDLLDLADTPVILVNTNVSRNTKTMVEKCRLRLYTYPKIIDHILESIANISKTLWQALKLKNLSLLPVSNNNFLGS